MFKINIYRKRVFKIKHIAAKGAQAFTSLHHIRRHKALEAFPSVHLHHVWLIKLAFCIYFNLETYYDDSKRPKIIL
jgi:hypothetical protein